MRRLVRAACPGPVSKVLARRQQRVNSGSPVKTEWNSFRRLKAYNDLRITLENALGWRARCAYCSDSYGADVEHFWPKSDFPERAFAFDNLCLICAPCNRKKTTKFPRTDSGDPLLIDPFFDDPWDSIFFSPATGWISARIVDVTPEGVHYSPKGYATLQVLGDLINAEPIASARRRSWLAIMERFRELITEERVALNLEEAFGDIDDYGLAEWLLYREGKEVPEVIRIRTINSSVWHRLRELPRA